MNCFDSKYDSYRTLWDIFENGFIKPCRYIQIINIDNGVRNMDKNIYYNFFENNIYKVVTIRHI